MMIMKVKNYYKKIINKLMIKYLKNQQNKNIKKL